jgi:hypothetical protein
MRLNRGTLILLIGSIIVIIAVLLISSGQVTAPMDGDTVNGTETPEGAGPLFADLTLTDLTGFEVRNNETDGFVQLTFTQPENDTEGVWTVSSATNASERDTDQQRAQAAVSTFTMLSAVDSFEADDLSAFGLDDPAYTLTGIAADGTEYTVEVGGTSPTAPRYYVRRTGTDSNTVYLIQQTQINTLTSLIEIPPYVPPPTPTPTATATPNPISEVQQTQTAEAVSAEETAIFATLEAQNLATATAEAAITETAD